MQEPPEYRFIGFGGTKGCLDCAYARDGECLEYEIEIDLQKTCESWRPHRELVLQMLFQMEKWTRDHGIRTGWTDADRMGPRSRPLRKGG